MGSWEEGKEQKKKKKKKTKKKNLEARGSRGHQKSQHGTGKKEGDPKKTSPRVNQRGRHHVGNSWGGGKGRTKGKRVTGVKFTKIGVVVLEAARDVT